MKRRSRERREIIVVAVLWRRKRLKSERSAVDTRYDVCLSKLINLIVIIHLLLNMKRELVKTKRVNCKRTKYEIVGFVYFYQ